ncbi:hypothetical protein SAMN05421510_101149 [Nitrosomonas ureae]|uniref:Uncharacterized protein n=1 Tax=Nitrosomonas ureae TaxID=44577 RepID=A0A1H9BYA0_9PROT|nr:hypothetical protein SAMN05421510_101149 [Nitrosomonas ureae]
MLNLPIIGKSSVNLSIVQYRTGYWITSLILCLRNPLVFSVAFKQTTR